MPTEQRKSARKPINTAGFLFAFDGQPIGPCQVKDVHYSRAASLLAATVVVHEQDVLGHLA